jgi:hypothetical protein
MTKTDGKPVKIRQAPEAESKFPLSQAGLRPKGEILKKISFQRLDK